MRTRQPRPFTIRANIRSDDPGGWNTSVVTVLHNGEEIGAYRQNYAAYSDTTFERFGIDGAWFALYSRDYTCTRIMSLPEICAGVDCSAKAADLLFETNDDAGSDRMRAQG